mmetsp:Transcript_12279/g.26120  ORF Transcript_12279/g.26120 Transcript_12279/m.26120 type:complete len:105 (-) Transcript_12279:1623-1937(-)
MHHSAKCSSSLAVFDRKRREEEEGKREHLSSSFVSRRHHQGSHHGNPSFCEVCEVGEDSFLPLVTLSQPSTRFVHISMRLWFCDNWDSFCDRKTSLHGWYALNL